MTNLAHLTTAELTAELARRASLAFTEDKVNSITKVDIARAVAFASFRPVRRSGEGVVSDYHRLGLDFPEGAMIAEVEAFGAPEGSIVLTLDADGTLHVNGGYDAGDGEGSGQFQIDWLPGERYDINLC
jgi:hypothetical protein